MASSGKAWLFATVSVVLTVVVLPLLLRVFVIEAFRLPSGSMIPTLQVGDHVFIDKLSYTPRRGDVIVHRFPKDRSKDFIKRIVALAGDTIAFAADGGPILNGSPVARRAVLGPCSYGDKRSDELDEWEKRSCSEFIEKLEGNEYHVYQDPGRSSRELESVTVPAGQVFVIGDNRDNSHDSRYWGGVPVEDIKGRMIAVWWHGGPPKEMRP